MTNDGMWLPHDQDPRMQATPTRGERECLIGYLDLYRGTLALKCDGLSAEQLATRAVPPSNISLLGLVRHMARVEQSWFRRVLAANMDLPRIFQDEDAGFDFGDVDDELVRTSHALLAGARSPTPERSSTAPTSTRSSTCTASPPRCATSSST